MKYAILCLVTLATPAIATGNQEMKDCLAQFNYSNNSFNEFDWSKAAWCASQKRVKQNKVDRAELRDFLKHNPRYRYPGQSLNRCWGKPREMPFEKSTLTVGPKGMEASVWYKDKIPAGCFETKPWDNRDVEG